jgi:hypothetical protein
MADHTSPRVHDSTLFMTRSASAISPSFLPIIVFEAQYLYTPSIERAHVAYTRATHGDFGASWSEGLNIERAGHSTAYNETTMILAQ